MSCDNLKKALNGSAACFSNSTVAIENGKKFILNSKSGKVVCRVKVDNCLITDKMIKKCDFLFNVEEDSKHFLVELKGGDLDTAVKQIESTFDFVNQKIGIPAANYTGIIVSSAVPRASTLKFQNLQDKIYRNKKLLIKRKSFVYEEKI